MLQPLIPSFRVFALTLLMTSAALASAASAAPIDTTQRPGPPSTEWNLDAPGNQPPPNMHNWAPMGMQGMQGMPGMHGMRSSMPHPGKLVPLTENGGCATREPSHAMPEHCSCMKPPMRKAEAPLPPEAYKMLEDRIGSLRAKLEITPEQEPAWQKVEQAMRANEESMRAMMMEKHAHANERNAVESLEKAQGFAQTHADNLANVIGPFKELYDAMPESQRQKADSVFREFRSMGGGHHAHHKKTAHKPTRKHADHGRKAPAGEARNAAPVPSAPPAAAPAPAPAAAQ